jgi:hypothetical protein
VTQEPPSPPEPPKKEEPTKPPDSPKKEQKPPAVPVVKAEPIGELYHFDHTHDVRRVSVSPDGREALVACWDARLHLWNLNDRREAGVYPGHLHAVHGVAFLPDGRHAVSGGVDQKVRLWNLDTGDVVQSLTGHAQEIHFVAASPDGKRAASCGPESTVFVWDLEAGKELHRLEGHEGGASSVAFTPDGKSLLVGTNRGPIRLWDVATGKEVRQLAGHPGATLAVAVSPDGRYALSGGKDGTVRVWLLESAREVRLLKGHAGEVFGVAFSPDGWRALSGGADKTLRLWDVLTGKEVQAFAGHTAVVWDVAFCPDGVHAVSGGGDHTLRLWRLPPAPTLAAGPLDLDPLPPAAPSRPAPPNAAAAAEVEAKLKDTFSKEFTKPTPEDLRALAAKLLRLAPEPKSKPAECYVLLREARDLAARAGDLELSLRAAEALANQFAVTPLEMKVEAFEMAGRAARSAAVRLDVATRALALADDAGEADDYEAAERLARAAQVSAGALSGLPVAAAARERVKEIAALRTAYEPARDAARTLTGRPEDPDANLTLGKFYALSRGDWDRGLTLLALGSDPKLKALAAADLASPADAPGARDLGDGYAARAESESGAAKTNLLGRACWWYEQAEGKLAGSERTRLEKKVAGVEKALPASRPVVLYARYGAYNAWTDVTDLIRRLVVQAPGQRLALPRSLTDLGIPDPAFGEHKSLVIVYRYRGGIHLSITGDSDTANVPALPGALDTAPGRPAPGQELVILYARYGNESTYGEAAAKTQAAVQGRTLTANPDQLGLGDPYPFRHKALVLVYREGGRVRLSVTPQEATVRLGGDSGKP